MVYKRSEHVLKASRTYMVASSNLSLPVEDEEPGEIYDREDWQSCVSVCMSSPSCFAAVKRDRGSGMPAGCRLYIPTPASRGGWRKLTHKHVAPTTEAPESWVKFVASNTTGGGFVPRGEVSIARAREMAHMTALAHSTPSCARACENDDDCIAFVHTGAQCIMMNTPPRMNHDDKHLPAHERGRLYSTCNRASDDHLNLDVRSNPLLLYPIVACVISIVVAGVFASMAGRRRDREFVPDDADELLWEEEE